MRFVLVALITSLLILSESLTAEENDPTAPYLYVLGEAQDAGRPQAGCYQTHCMKAFESVEQRRYATSLALVLPESKKDYLFEATPDIKYQLYELHGLTNHLQHHLAGIFLTHAHIGHYVGLMNLGREVMGTSGMPVYVMPKMQQFLTDNGPWSQLVALENIQLRGMKAQQAVTLDEGIEVTPLRVPHRDEYSETVGYVIAGPNKKALFIPDIDKWERWSLDLLEQVEAVDYALLDATFYAQGELPGRDMNEIPHPLVTDTMERLKDSPEATRAKVYFIHMNHTNPLLDEHSEATKTVLSNGFNIARRGMMLEL